MEKCYCNTILVRSSDRKVDPEFVLISCNRLQGIRLQGQTVCNSSVNTSLTIKSLIDSQAESKKISVELKKKKKRKKICFLLLFLLMSLWFAGVGLE